jgi:hypothetical protein
VEGGKGKIFLKAINSRTKERGHETCRNKRGERFSLYSTDIQVAGRNIRYHKMWELMLGIQVIK